MGDWMDSPVGPGRGRPRQRDVVLAPRPQHRLRPARRAAARRRQQGAASTPSSRRSCSPPGAVFDTSRAQGLRRQPAAAARRAGQHPRRRRRAPSRRPRSTTRPATPGAGPGHLRLPGQARPQAADGSPDAGKDVFNGGLRVDITKLNVAGISDGNAVTTLKVQCRGCDDHPGIDPDGDGYITVAEDFNQSPGYAQAGLTAAVNRPLAKNRERREASTGGRCWRAACRTCSTRARAMDVEFFQGPATCGGDTGGAPGPRRAPTTSPTPTSWPSSTATCRAAAAASRRSTRARSARASSR